MLPQGRSLVDSKALARAMMDLQGTILDGEMVSSEPPTPGNTEGRSKYVTSIMGSHESIAIEKQHRDGWLRYVVFDVLAYRGEDVRRAPYSERSELARLIVQAWGHPFAVAADRCPDITRKQEWLDELWERGEEGIMLKRRAAPYGDRQSWVKVKSVLSVDGVVMGFEEPKRVSRKVTGDASETKFYERGWIGALQIGQYAEGKLVEIATVSGMTDELRDEISKRRSRYIGQVVEIKANGREPTGRYRHPQFVRFRTDKRPEECVVSCDET